MHNLFRLLLTILLIITFKFSNAQSGLQGVITDKEWKRQEENNNCIHRNKYSIVKRMHLYPFSKANQIQLVSFENGDNREIKSRLPMKNGVVDYTKLKEIRTLNRSEIISLTDILFNYSYKGNLRIGSKSLCYNPRNAILFVDSSGQAFEYIELCFECEGDRESSLEVRTGDFCEQKYELLKAFFRKVGITYGVKNE